MILFNHTGKGKAGAKENCKWWFPDCNQFFLGFLKTFRQY